MHCVELCMEISNDILQREITAKDMQTVYFHNSAAEETTGMTYSSRLWIIKKNWQTTESGWTIQHF